MRECIFCNGICLYIFLYAHIHTYAHMCAPLAPEWLERFCSYLVFKSSPCVSWCPEDMNSIPYLTLSYQLALQPFVSLGLLRQQPHKKIGSGFTYKCDFLAPKRKWFSQVHPNTKLWFFSKLTLTISIKFQQIMKDTSMNKAIKLYFQGNIGLLSSGPNKNFLLNSLKAVEIICIHYKGKR
jgi:hypothetical protein